MSVAGKTYVFKDSLTFAGFSTGSLHGRFRCDGSDYDYLHINAGDGELGYATSSPMSLDVAYMSGAWTDADYKTIRFISDPTDSSEAATLAAWLAANATEKVTNYLVTDASLYQIADKLREKARVSGRLEMIEDFLAQIEKLAYTQDANAAAGDLRSGKTAYVNKVKISGNLTGKEAATYNTSGSDQTIASGQILDGAQTIKGVTTENIEAGNIKPGVTMKVGDANNAGRIKNVTSNMPSKAAGTYNTSSSDQTIAADQYLTGTQTIKGVTTQNIDAGNIKKGVVVKVGDANNAGRIKDVTGSYGTIVLTATETSAMACTHSELEISTTTPGIRYSLTLSYDASSFVPSGGAYAGCVEWTLGNLSSSLAANTDVFIDDAPSASSVTISFVVRHGASATLDTIPANSLTLKLKFNAATIT